MLKALSTSAGALSSSNCTMLKAGFLTQRQPSFSSPDEAKLCLTRAWLPYFLLALVRKRNRAHLKPRLSGFSVRGQCF